MNKLTTVSRLVLVGVGLHLLTACAVKHGSIAGNAFWKYSDTDSSKPDSGAEVFLFSEDTTQRPLVVTCDSLGNFSFSNIPVGDYTLVTRSRAAHSTAPDQIHDFVNYLYEPVVDYGSVGDKQLISKFIEAYYGAKTHVYYRPIADHLADSIFNLLPGNSPLIKWVYRSAPMGPEKVKIQKVRVEAGKPNVIVIDFGS